MARRAARAGAARRREAGRQDVDVLAAARMQHERAWRRAVDVEVVADDRAARVERAEPPTGGRVAVGGDEDAAPVRHAMPVDGNRLPERQRRTAGGEARGAPA